MTRIRVTHPFHPLFGETFVQVTERSSRHGDRVWYEAPDGSVATIPRAWTDLATLDPFVELAEGKAHFRVRDLVELAEVVAALQAANPMRSE